MPEPAMLELDQVRAGYGPLEVLRGVSLTVKRGEIVTLIGANGAGKSTTLNTICGLIKARGGAVRLDGADVTQLQPSEIVARGLSQVPEGRKLFSDMTVRENLEMGAFLRRDNDAIARDLAHCFELFPILEDRQGQMAGSLSGGEQQMCAIARAIMARPKMLLLDEPSLGLAPLIVKQIFEIVKQLNDEGTTVFLVEQNAAAALKLAHRGYVMETGRITFEDDASKLATNPEVRKAYLGG
jgi:branched-chain amino acid transport system ATP-binding protein